MKINPRVLATGLCGLLVLISTSFASAPKQPASPSEPASDSLHLTAPVPIQNPGVAELSPEGFDRVLAISDVHGMYPQLIKLLKAARLIDSGLSWVGGKALLVVTGDSIDKGPQSVETIDLWMSLIPQAKSAGGGILHLLGNHEAEFLADPTNKKTEAFQTELRQKNISIQEFTHPSYPRAQFLLSLPVAAKVGAWMFSHSGYYSTLNWADFKSTASLLLSNLTSATYGNVFFSGDFSILEAKKWEVTPYQRASVEAALSANGFVGSVFGHQPGALRIKGACGVSSDHRLIKIDNGMAPEAGAHKGSILNFPNPKQLMSTDVNSASSIQVHAISSTGEILNLAEEAN